MSRYRKGEIRRSQLITTYGIGSIVSIEDESFMIAGLDRWDIRRPNLHEPRLERRLQVTGFVLPPASDDRDDIPVVRFPTWVYCPGCHRLQEHRRFTSHTDNLCDRCGLGLIPSRFVVCCPKGHADDFPYFNWVHAGTERTTGTHEMTIGAGGKTASLDDIVISCSCGIPGRTMKDAFQRDALKRVRKCTGRRPWLTTDDAECDETPRVLQRGASNVWFAVTHSSISIPPWSEGAFKVLNRRWEVLKYMPPEALEPTIDGMGLAEGTPYSVADLVEAVIQRRAGEEAAPTTTQLELRRDEYRALVSGRAEETLDQDFVCLPVDRMPDEVRQWFATVNIVTRLREVRALESFARVVPSVADSDGKPPLADAPPSWLPAIEVRGEGIFFQLAHEPLRRWEDSGPVTRRVAEIDARYRRRLEDFGRAPDRRISPRHVLIHTLGHALISQMALDCGYPAAALRERLYVDDEMCGLLILTATSDSAGSLGGLIGQAAPTRLLPTLVEAVTRAAWCSADPLCIETTQTGLHGLNMAACHACTLLPEVSCEEMNVLLDRALLVGTGDHPDLGYFNELLR